MDELRANCPDQYARVVKGIKPNAFRLTMIAFVLSGGMFLKYLPNISASISEIGSPETASNYDRGLDAYNRHDFATALKYWYPLAEQGDAGAQAYLGTMYQNAQGVPQNDQAALKWLTLAAKRDQPDAQNLLAMTYFYGKGADQNHYAAFEWAIRAADQRNKESEFLLGLMYARGEGVSKDDVYAHMWLQIANIQGHPQSGWMLKEVRERMSPAQIESAEALARGWMEKHPY